MARTFDQVKVDILTMVGRDDATAESITSLSLNLAIEIVALLYDLPEIHLYGELTFETDVDELLLTGNNKLIDIITVRNHTDVIQMGFIPLENLDLVAPTTGKPKIFSRDGNALLIKPKPSVPTRIRVRYTAFLKQTLICFHFLWRRFLLSSLGVILLLLFPDIIIRHQVPFHNKRTNSIVPLTPVMSNVIRI